MDDGSPVPEKRPNTRPAIRTGVPRAAQARPGQPVDPRTDGQVVDGTGGTRRPAARPRVPGTAGVIGVPRLAGATEAATPVPPALDEPNADAAEPAGSAEAHQESLADLHDSLPTALPVIVPAIFDEPETADDAVASPVSPGSPPTLTLPATMPPPVPEYTDTDGTGGLPSLTKPKRPGRALKPVVMPQRRPRVRRVTRVVRHVDTWSVFKVALVFNVFMYVTCLLAGVLLWQVAQNTGTVDNVQRFFESFGWKTFELKGGEIFHNAWVAGLFVVVAGTGLVVLMATLFNLITDLVGGIRVSVLEEEVVAREVRGLGWRRARQQRPAAQPFTEPFAEEFPGPPVEPV